MDAYTGFAQVYDLFMDNVPYDEWCAYICETLKKHGIADGPVLDLGCGTGELTRRLAAQITFWIEKFFHLKLFSFPHFS